MSIKVTVWNEFVHEQEREDVRSIYPNGIHNTIKDFLQEDSELQVITATLEEEDHGLTDDVLNNTDVLIWWGHAAHDKVRDDIVFKVCERVRHGMGLIVLHSGHFSKVFKSLMGTKCSLKWREVAEKCRVWTVDETHPITKGVGEFIELEHEEMYGEPFRIPTPEELVFISWFKGGEVFRSGCVFKRDRGKIFYFQPGHETYPIYHNKKIQTVITNACKYVNPVNGVKEIENGVWVKQPLEEI